MPNFIQLTSPLILHADPILPSHAATKQYVDNKRNSVSAGAFTTGTISVARMPALTGDVSSVAGSGIISLNVNGVASGTYSKVTVDGTGRVTAGGALAATDIAAVSWAKITSGKPTTAVGYGITNLISLSGGTVSGNISSTATPSASLHAVTKGYVDNAITGVVSASLSVGDVIRKTATAAPSGFLRCNGGVVSRTTYASLFSVIGTTHDKPSFSNNNGRPWAMQYDFNSSQSTDVSDWATSASLPNYSSTPAITSNRIYLLGGTIGGGGTSAVYTATLGTNGTVGTWTSGPPLPAIYKAGKACTVNGRLYLLAGNIDSNNFSNLIYSAPIAGDGTIGAWTTQNSSITNYDNGVYFQFGQPVTLNDKIYLIKSSTTSQGECISVEVYAINTQGQFSGRLSNTGVSNLAIYAGILPKSVAIRNRFYFFYLDTNIGALTYRQAEILPDGTLSSFGGSQYIPFGNLAANSVNFSIITTEIGFNKLYIVRSQEINFYVADIDASGNLSNWRTEAVVPSIVSFQETIVSASQAYLLAGYGSYSVSQTVSVFSVNTNGSLTAFVSSTQPQRRPQAILVANKVHVFGNNDNIFSSSVYTGTVAANGILNSISTAGVVRTLSLVSTLPAAIGNSQVIVTKSRVYLLGGIINGTVSSVVHSATLAPDGTLGAWTTELSLPGGVHNSHAVMTSNRVYLLGGNNGSVSTSTVYTAAVDDYGILSGWSVITSLPVTIELSQVAVVANRMYLLGGVINNTASSSVYVATINDNGTLGQWAVSTIPLPTDLHSSQVVVVKNRLYLFGGVVGGNISWAVRSVMVNADGTLGAWQFNTTLPPTANYSYLSFQPIVTSSKIYLFGSRSTETLAYVGSFSGGFNDYTNYVDKIVVATTNFTLPDFTSLEKNSLNYFIKT